MDSNTPELGERETLESAAELSQSEAASDVAATVEAEAVADPASVTEDAPAVVPPDTAEEAPSAGSDTPVEESWFEPASVPSGLKRGELVEGTITRTAPTAVYVDIGAKTEAVVPSRELERMSRPNIEALKEGEKVTVYVVNPNDHQGNIVVSLNRALEELDWKQAEAYRESQEVYEARVAGYNKGGLIVRFGRLRGFVPQSQMSDERRRLMNGETPEERYGKMINNPISVKVMEVDRSRNRLILSERIAFREVREKRKEALIEELTVGEVRTGHIVSLEDFGAFVDIGGAEGLVHLTELSWRHINHPKELFHIGQEVKVEVISVDKERKRIGLSLKRQEADPWDEVAMTYTQGQLVQAVVTKLAKFGAFAKLVDAPDIEGLIHISELSDQRVNHPKEVVKEGEKLTLRVVKVDVKNRRLGLSLKRVNSAEFLDMDWSNPNSGP
jgi:small subunit ribosomal protein S1